MHCVPALVGMVAVLVQNMLIEVGFRRPLWFLVAVAAVLEYHEAMAVQKRRSQQPLSVEPDLDPLAY